MKVQRRLARAFLEEHPGDAAAALESLSPKDAAAVLAECPAALSATVLKRAAPHLAAATCAELEVDKASAVMVELPLDVAAALLRRMAEGPREKILESLPNRGATLRSLLRLLQGTAGTMMNPHVLALPEEMSVQTALARVRQAPEHVLHNLYVIDQDHVLVGVLSLQQLLAADDKSRLSEIMRGPSHRLSASATPRAVVSHPGWRQVCSLPVVDERNTFLGAIGLKTLRRLEEEIRGDAEVGAPTVRALGDLFWTGLGGLMEAVGNTIAPIGPGSAGPGD